MERVNVTVRGLSVQQGPIDVECHISPPPLHHIEMIALILRSNPDQFHQKVCCCKNSNNLFIRSKKNLAVASADTAWLSSRTPGTKTQKELKDKREIKERTNGVKVRENKRHREKGPKRHKITITMKTKGGNK